VFEMDAVAAADPAGRLITISGQWLRDGTPAANYMRVYVTDTGDNRRPMHEATQIAVTIDTIIPSPASMVLLVLTGGSTARRRRR
jgi:hypothetical protein